MDKYISSIVKTCFHQLREFRRIRSFIPKSAAIIFANAFIHSRMDYCNNLFYGLPKYSINRLQRIQNSVARIVTRTSRLSNITPILKSLHWLPVQCRINFKLCCITHRALSLGEPHYLNSLLFHRDPGDRRDWTTPPFSYQCNLKNVVKIVFAALRSR